MTIQLRLGLAILALVGALSAQTGNLAGNIRLALVPLRMEYNLRPGATVTDAAHVGNEAVGPVRMTATVNNWTLAPSGSPDFLTPDQPAPDAYACANWIQVNPTEFFLVGGGMQRVRYTIHVPANAPTEGCRAAILFTSEPPDLLPPTSQVRARVRLATIIYIRVGNPAVVGQISDISLAPPPALPPAAPSAPDPPPAAPAWALHVAVRNSGATYFRVGGQAEVLDGAGKPVASFTIGSEVVLAASTRVFSFPCPASLPPGTYTLRATLDWGQPALERIEKTVVLGALPAAAPNAPPVP